jgi:hypothetical protein
MADRRETSNCDLLDQIAGDLSNEPDVAMGTMFRSAGLRVAGKVIAFAGHDGQLIVKLPRSELVDAETANGVVMGKWTVREWVTVPVQQDCAATLTL